MPNRGIMKKILVLLVLIFSAETFANKISLAPAKLSYQKYYCKQKILPVDVEYKADLNTINLNFISETGIRDFKITSIRGIDGLSVKSPQSRSSEDLKPGETLQINVNYSRPEGLSYLIIDIEGRLRDEIKRQSMSFPIGELSNRQVQEQQKSKKLIKMSNGKKEQKYNIMRLKSN